MKDGRRDRGTVLPVMLVLTAALLLTIALLASILGAAFERTSRRGAESVAFAAAEAGAEKAIAEVRRRPSYHGETLRLGEASVEVEVRPEAGGLRRIVSVGEFRSRRRSVEVRVWRDPSRERLVIVEWDEGR